MKYYIFVILIIILGSCKIHLNDVQSGEIKRIPFTENNAVGTDSTIMIIDRTSGTILNIIYRK